MRCIRAEVSLQERDAVSPRHAVTDTSASADVCSANPVQQQGSYIKMHYYAYVMTDGMCSNTV